MSDDISPDLGAHDTGDDSISVAYGDSTLDAGSAGFDADDHGLTDTAEPGDGYEAQSDTDAPLDDVQPMDKFPEPGADAEPGGGSEAGSGAESTSDTDPSDSAGDASEPGGDAAGSGDAAGPGDEGLHSAMGPEDSGTEQSAGDESPSEGASTDLTVSIDGEDIVVGAPTLDITGDGVADTVVVESEGNVEYYVDTDQDGVADQIIVLDETDGTLVSHEVYDPATGEWTNVTDESTGTPD
ncbi:DUF6802 family protein [Cumulibacter manganitolerans]|uniref:DUF6802 family protein n=1 Tax=Cumulibacter manganitolerans TaxID=1884992 RepID=UPI0012978A39|nr:DUF6802 family protein [Cumulibacter manganitolerans]